MLYPWHPRQLGSFVLLPMLLFTFLLPSQTMAAETSLDAQAAWDESIHAVRERVFHNRGALLRGRSSRLLERVSQNKNKPISETFVEGEIESVPSGLIHHWIGTILIPNAEVSDVVSVLQDYESYNKVYAPAVVESKLRTHTQEEFSYQLKFVQKGFGVRVGLAGEFRTTYYQTDADHGFSVTEATKLKEIENPGGPDEKFVDGNRSLGYVKNSFTIVRYQQSIEGTIVQVESLTLSRGLNASVRWIVIPVVRRFSQQTILATLERLRSNVQPARDLAFASTK